MNLIKKLILIGIFSITSVAHSSEFLVTLIGWKRI